MHNSNITDQNAPYPEDLSETINEVSIEPLDDASPLTETIGDEFTVTTDDHATPKIAEPHILEQLNLETEHKQRYQAGHELGSGGGGFVIEVTDYNLERSVAAKFLDRNSIESPRKIQKFIHEALITAQLDHPNILPIYTLQATENKELFYTMKKVEGISLCELTSPKPWSTHPDNQNLILAYNNLSEIINIIIKVTETLAYAHSKGIIHRDIKPSNVMLDKYGEVRVVDWGIATKVDQQDNQEGKLSGTPLYMSPEQAQRKLSDKRSDIYAIGTTLFHVLFKRPPLFSENQETFWRLKKLGHITEPSPQELKQIPKTLLAICMKCIQAKPEHRYQDADILVNELKAFQTGGTIHAYRYSTIEIVKAWYQHNKNNITWTLLIFVLVFLSAIYWYNQHQRELAGWGAPIYVENFDTPTEWQQHWSTLQGTHSIENNALVTKGGPSFTAFYNTQIQGGIRIEFEGTILPESNPGDLSIVYTPDLLDTTAQGTPRSIYYLQHGSQGNQSSAILGPDGRLDYAINPLAIGRTYKIRGEIDGKHMRLFLDDQLICAHEFLFPLTSGYIGLYGFFHGKQFDNIRIYSKELPEITSIIKTGDLLYEHRLFELAAKRYEKISDTHKNTELGTEARYKYALCKYKQGLTDEAFLIWGELEQSVFKQQILFYRWNEYLKTENYETLISEMSKLYNTSDRSTQEKIEVKWTSLIADARSSNNIALVRSLIRFRENHFPNDQRSSISVFYALRFLGETDRILDMFPKQETIVGRALLETGQYDKIINEFPTHRHLVVEALFDSGQYNKVISEHSDIKEALLEALIAAGYFEKAKIEFADNEQAQIRILIAEGAYQQAMEQFPNNTSVALHAHLNNRDFKSYFELINNKGSLTKYDKSAIALQQYLSGDRKSLESIRSIQQSYTVSEKQNVHRSFDRIFLFDVLNAINGNSASLKSHAEKIYTEKKKMMGMRLWHNSALLLGKIDKKTFMQQPFQPLVEFEFHLFKGIHEDVWGNKQVAKEHYIKALELKPHRSNASIINTLFMAHRITEISD